MDGQNESLQETTNQRLASFEKTLDEYVSKIGIGKMTYNPIEVQQCMDLTYEQMSKLSGEECEMRSWTLNKFSAYVTQEVNRHKSRILWAKTNLDSLVAKQFNNVGDQYTKYDVKVHMICNNDVSASALHNIILHAEARACELNEISKHITSLSKNLSNLKYSKREEK